MYARKKKDSAVITPSLKFGGRMRFKNGVSFAIREEEEEGRACFHCFCFFYLENCIHPLPFMFFCSQTYRISLSHTHTHTHIWKQRKLGSPSPAKWDSLHRATSHRQRANMCMHAHTHTHTHTHTHAHTHAHCRKLCKYPLNVLMATSTDLQREVNSQQQIQTKFRTQS